jgi:hypothetical protein
MRPFHATSMLSVLACLTACSSSPSGDANPGTPPPSTDTRTVITCADTASQYSAAGLAYDANSWGTLPAAFQHVPPGGTFCGVSPGDVQTAVVLTTLSGEALLDFYAPFFTQLQCTTAVGTGTLAGTYPITCQNGGNGLLSWDPHQQVAYLGFNH